MPRKYIPPKISTPVSWKYVHNRWNMHNSVLSTESTGLNRLFSCRIFHSTLSYPPKVSTAPENKYLHRRYSRKYSLSGAVKFSVVTGCTCFTCISDVREPISLHQAVRTYSLTGFYGMCSERLTHNQTLLISSRVTDLQNTQCLFCFSITI